MIKIYRKGKLFKKYPKLDIKNINDIEIIFKELIGMNRKTAYKMFLRPIYCEEPMSNLLVGNDFNLQTY